MVYNRYIRKRSKILTVKDVLDIINKINVKEQEDLKTIPSYGRIKLKLTNLNLKER